MIPFFLQENLTILFPIIYTMETNVFLYTAPQWIIFAALISLAYGWIEKKKVFNLLGLGILIVLGLFAVYAIIQGYFVFNKFLTPEEIIMEELEEEYVEEIPMQARLLPAYWLFIVSGIFSIPGIFLVWKKKKYARAVTVISAVIALGGFFIIVGALRA